MTPAATIILGPRPGLRPAPPLPLDALLLGKPLAEVADLLPRLFNLCRAAQGMAARLSLGLPTTGDPRAEILRDHALKLCITLPRAFGLAPLPLPHPATNGGASLPPGGGGMGWGGTGSWGESGPWGGPLAGLLGPKGLACAPDRIEGPLAPLFHLVAATFPPGMATTAALPPPPGPLAEGAYENSPAGRQSQHPLLCAIETSHGRGPLWRLAGLMADLGAALDDRLPAPSVTDGIATVPAARGAYALRLTHANGIVTGLSRRTPTDHLLAPGGALLQALATLPATHHHLAPQVIALHDPCIPVTVREAQDA